MELHLCFRPAMHTTYSMKCANHCWGAAGAERSAAHARGTPIQTLSILVRSVANSRRKRLRDTLFERKSLNLPSNNLGSSNPPSNHLSSSNPPSNNPASSNQPSNNPPTELDEILANLPADPGLRPPMTYYNPNF
ncbi:unnamed protein product [Prunus armeniaca]